MMNIYTQTCGDGDDYDNIGYSFRWLFRLVLHASFNLITECAKDIQYRLKRSRTNFLRKSIDNIM